MEETAKRNREFIWELYPYKIWTTNCREPLWWTGERKRIIKQERYWKTSNDFLCLYFISSLANTRPLEKTLVLKAARFFHPFRPGPLKWVIILDARTKTTSCSCTRGYFPEPPFYHNCAFMALLNCYIFQEITLTTWKDSPNAKITMLLKILWNLNFSSAWKIVCVNKFAKTVL